MNFSFGRAQWQMQLCWCAPRGEDQQLFFDFPEGFGIVSEFKLQTGNTRAGH